MQPSLAASEAVVVVFHNGQPKVIYAPLTGDGTTLYGVSTYGGSGGCTDFMRGCGTVFSVQPDGAVKIIYSFKGGKDGYGATRAPLSMGGTLYGVTGQGGSTKCGAT